MPPIILTTPAASGVKTYKNGVKVYRLHEFLGPARGTLTTESDPWSLCGTVVRDTQTVAYDVNNTIQPAMLSSAADTFRIPMADLNLGTRFEYGIYIGLRAEGTIDLTKQDSTHRFLEIGNNSANISIYTTNAARTSTFGPYGINVYAPKELTNPYYKVIDFGASFAQWHFTEGQVEMIIRAATGTGGLFQWILDCMYLVPRAANDLTNPDDPYADTDFRTIFPDTDFDPVKLWKTSTWDLTRDDSPVDWLDGQYSVNIRAPSGFIDGSRGFADYQEGDIEYTVPNIYGKFTSVGFENDPSTDLTIIAGSHYTPSHTIDTDDFDRTTTQNINQYLGESDENRAWWIRSDHPMQASSGTSGIYCDGTQLHYREGKQDAEAFPYFWPSSNAARIADVVSANLGATSIENGVGGTSIQHENLTGMQHCIMTCKVTTDHLLVAGFSMNVGFAAADGSQFMGIQLDIPSAGNWPTPSTSLVAALTYCRSLAGTTAQDIQTDTPTTLTTSYSANTFVWCKVEMDWYRFRGKAWLDGDTEPADWMFEGHIPDSNNTTPFATDLYPWDDNETRGQDRRSQMDLFPILACRYYSPLEDINGNDVQFSIHPVRLTSTKFRNLTLEYDAKGETPQDVHISVDTYDGEDYGSLTIPYEAQRVVISPTAKHTFNNDDDGYAITMWKETGAPDTQAAVVGDIIQKRILGGPIWLNIRLRPFEINEVD